MPSQSAEDLQTLRRSRQLRNKLLHADFHQVHAKLSDSGAALRPGRIGKLQIPTGGSPLQTILGGLAAPDAIPSVADMTTREAGLFGGFLQLGLAGGLAAAEQVFQKANAIVDRLLLIEL